MLVLKLRRKRQKTCRISCSAWATLLKDMMPVLFFFFKDILQRTSCSYFNHEGPKLCLGQHPKTLHESMWARNFWKKNIVEKGFLKKPFAVIRLHLPSYWNELPGIQDILVKVREQQSINMLQFHEKKEFTLAAHHAGLFQWGSQWNSRARPSEI